MYSLLGKAVIRRNAGIYTNCGVADLLPAHYNFICLAFQFLAVS